VLKVGADDRWLVKREALRRIKNRFDAESIEIAYPHLTIIQGETSSGDG
jgi:small conductance mechanosensitive channel